MDKNETNAPSPMDFSDYAVMGVWIANWSQLFPWMVSGHSNEVPPDSQAIDMVRLRRLQQDLLTLSKLYRRFAMNPNPDPGQPPRVLKVQPMTDKITFAQLADDFGAGVRRIARHMAATIKEDKKAKTPGEAIRETLKALNRHAQVIYATWNRLGFLREAELGLGITYRSPLHNGVDHSITGFDQKLIHPMNPRPNWMGMVRLSLGSIGTLPMVAVLQPCDFDGTKSIKNYQIFATSIKGSPLIFTDENMEGRVACYVEGPHPLSCGILAQESDLADFGAVTVWQDLSEGQNQARRPGFGPGGKVAGDGQPGWFPILFDKPPEGDGAGREHLYARVNTSDRPTPDGSEIRLWPIPFEAADGVDKWLGQSMATGDGGLEDQLATVLERLRKTERWSFDSNIWDRRDPAKMRYSTERIGAVYAGLIPKPKPDNIFGA